MNFLTDDEIVKIDKNRARLARIGDRGITLDLFASVTTDDLTLAGEVVRDMKASERRQADDGQATFL